MSATHPQLAARRGIRGSFVVLIGCGLVLIAEFLWFQRQRRELATVGEAVRTAVQVQKTEDKLSRAQEELKTARTRAASASRIFETVDIEVPEATQVTIRRKFAVERSEEFLRLKALRQKLGVVSRYAPLFEKLQLDQAGRETLTQLLLNKLNFADDFNTAWGAHQNAEMAAAMKITDPKKYMATAIASMTSLKGAHQKAKDDLEDSFKSALGDTGYPVYLDFEKHLAHYVAVIELQQSVAGTDAALSHEQFKALAQLFTEKEVTRQSAPVFLVSMPPRERGSYYVGGQHYLAVGYGSPFYSDAAGTLYTTYLPQEEEISRAASFLGPAQLSGLQKLRETKQARVDLLHAFQGQ